MFKLKAAVTPSLSSYARTRVASSFTISVPNSSASPALSSVPLNRSSFGG